MHKNCIIVDHLSQVLNNPKIFPFFQETLSFAGSKMWSNIWNLQGIFSSVFYYILCITEIIFEVSQKIN